jgi:thiosulfate/3-mercaptopyruvate sulfurtransferase
VKRAERGGHIPGAVNISRKSLLDKSTGLLRPLQDQRQVFEDAGVDCSGNGSQQIYTYCNGGVASCSLALALDRLGLGQNCANYDGSWNEWGNELQFPVQTGK